MTFVKYVALALAMFGIASKPCLKAADEGFVEGHLKIMFAMAAQASDDMPRPETGGGPYTQYPLIILAEDGKKEIAPVTADENGNYRVPLPPGNYLLDVQDRVRKHVRASRQHFTVLANQTVRVDMNIAIGPGID
jgi:hypothetical protein